MSLKSSYLMPVVAAGLALAMLGSLPAEATNTFTVFLKNDTSFSTLRQPTVADWDEETVLVLTSTGNWIGIPKADIVRISASVEERNIGRVIDSRTIALGVLANDEPTDEELAAEDAARSPLDRFLDRFEDLVGEGPAQQNYNQRQFVDPDEASGIPLNYLGDFAAPIGGAIEEADQ